MADETDDLLPGLMARYQSGDGSAFEDIYRLTVGSVEGYMARWAKAKDRDDLVQETYLQVHRARRTFRPGLPFRPWLFAIARHVALGAIRTHRRRWAKEVGVDVYPEAPEPPPEPDPWSRSRLEAALERLSPEMREVVWLARVEGMSSVEIGKVVGATPGAIKVRLHRANRKLREWLEPSLGGADA